jgi:hypothetical protein
MKKDQLFYACSRFPFVPSKEGMGTGTGAMFLFHSLQSLEARPAFRPLRLSVCRKRRGRQGNPPGRFAGLDPSRLAPGHENLRARDGNAFGGLVWKHPIKTKNPKNQH